MESNGVKLRLRNEDAVLDELRAIRRLLRRLVGPRKPPPPPPPPEGMRKADGIPGDILRVLDAAGRRLTSTEVLAAMVKQGLTGSESTVKTMLSALVDVGYLDNQQNVNPKGYSVTSFGRGAL